MKHDSDILKRIKQYFMRRKSASEARKFEGEVERDPFLYEAMEGLEGMLASDLQQSMDELDDRLDAKASGLQAIPFLKQAAAIAAILVIGISAYFIIERSGADPEQAMAPTETKHITPTDGRYEPRDDHPSFESLPIIVMKEDTARGDMALAASEEETPTVQMPDITPVETDVIPEEEEVVMAVPKPAVADSEPLADDALALGASPAASEDTQTDDYEQVEELAVAEETTIESTMSRKATSAYSAVEGAVKGEEKASPTGGMSAFNQYVQSNKKTSEAMPNGAVVLSFDLDRKGRPKNIEVVESLCTACDAEAIRLLEEGPTWEGPSRKQRNSVAIQL